MASKKDFMNHPNKTTALTIQEIADAIFFFVNENSSSVNFFVMNREGKYLYKNYACECCVNAKKTNCSNPVYEKIYEVMETKKTIIKEEIWKKGRIFLSVKSPFIINNKVEGIVGLAIDITDRKKKEELERHNALQNVMLRKRAKFEKLSGEVLHNIQTPMMSLEMLAARNSLPKDEQATLAGAIAKIREISSMLLFLYKENTKMAYELEEQPIPIFLILLGIITQKNAQLSDSNLKVQYHYNLEDNLTFIIGDEFNIKRMILNLICNSVEAAGGNTNGAVDVNLLVDNENVKIIIQDNGEGISPDIIKKLHKRESINAMKGSSRVFGLEQIFSAIKKYQGTLAIESEESIGTKFTLTFPVTAKPKYIKDTIFLHKGSVVVCLDDDESVLHILRKLFVPHKDDVEVHFFTQHSDASSFLSVHKEMKNLFLISDYELRGQGTDGVFFVLENNMRDKSMLITNMDNGMELQGKIKRSGIDMLPKQFLPNLKIYVN